MRTELAEQMEMTGLLARVDWAGGVDSARGPGDNGEASI